ncbi:MAG: glycosyltransferase [Bacteroidales bacterium]|jgi:glycosyltransferase involved in cell wall biosynthesis|nr:glycosyltransferase [Bacteroidales bacterium]
MMNLNNNILQKSGKRVVVSVTNDLVSDGRMIRTCSALNETGYDVIFMGRVSAGSPPLSPQNFRQKRIRCLFRKGVFFYMEFNLRLLARLICHRADILVAADLDTLLPNTIAAWLKGARLIYDAHEYFTEVPELEGRNFVRGVWERIGKLCVPKADLCLTVSGSLSEILANKYAKPFHVIMNVPGYRAAGKQVSASQVRVPVIVYRGAINQGRGLEESIMAMKRIPARLKIAGEGPLLKKLKETVRINDLDEKVIFTGRLSSLQLDLVTADATIGLNILSGNSLSYRHSLGNKFFDYIHCGIPQICIDLPEYKAINDKYEIALLCSNREEDIAAAVNRLIGDSQLSDRLRENCRKAALELNWQNEKIKLLSLISDL